MIAFRVSGSFVWSLGEMGKSEGKQHDARFIGIEEFGYFRITSNHLLLI
jgi:hypothetical protein